MRLIKSGAASKVGDESTATGGSTTADGSTTIPDGTQSEYSDQQLGEEIEANAAKIMDSIERTGENWASSSPAERMIAASACPKALYAELQEQLSKHDENLDSDLG